MFDITLNGKQLYHPNSIDCNISSAVLHEALNDSGYMNLTIPYNNPLWEEVVERKGQIVVYKDNSPLWYGEVRDVSVDFAKNKSLYIVGEAAYLNDTVQPQKKYTDITKYNLLTTMVNIHNSMVEADKRFEVGTVGANSGVRRNCVTDWEYTLDAIRKHICDDEEYVRIRHINNVRYIDIMPIENYGKHSDQTIMFGDNLLDYTEDSSGEEIASICIPLGKSLDEENIPDYTNYLTCESANGGKNYVYLPGAVERIGKITKVVHFNVIDSPSALVTAGINWLKEKQYAKLTLKLTAVDLSVLHSDIDNYSVGDYVHAICEPMGMDAWFPVRERETDLLNLSNNNITVGSVGAKSITAQQAEKVEEIETLMPKKDSILAQAKKNASALLNSAGKDGHVVFRQNDQGVIYEILIMDTPDIDTASKMWRFNENGIGYADSKDASGQWAFKTAWTMDGHFNADAITCDNLEVGKNVTMGENATIGWSKVGVTGDAKPDLATKNDLSGFITSSSLNGLYSGVTTLYYCHKDWYTSAKQGPPSPPTAYVSDNTGYEDRWTTVCPTPDYQNYAITNNGVVTGYYYNYAFYQCTQYTKKQNGSVVYEWSAVQEFDNSVSTTVITKNSVTTSFINALGITAQNISATTLNGKTLNIGGSYGSGGINFYDDLNAFRSCMWNEGYGIYGDVNTWIRLELGYEETASGSGGYFPELNFRNNAGDMARLTYFSDEPFAIAANSLKLNSSRNNQYVTITLEDGELNISTRKRSSSGSTYIKKSGKGYTGSSSGSYKFINGIAVET